MFKKLYNVLATAVIALCFTGNLVAQQSGGSIVLTSFGDSTYTTGMAGEFTDIPLRQGQTVNVKGMYGDLATVREVNVNYQIFAPDWSGIVYIDEQVFANDSLDNLDGIIDFDYIIPMDADTAGQHDVDSMTVAFDFIQVRVWHDSTANLDVFWYEFTNVQPFDSTSSSIPKIKKLEGLNVYPNTAGDFITIDSPKPGIKSIMMYDVAGKRVLNQKLEGRRLNVQGLLPGYYTVRIEQEGEIGIVKVMIN